MDGYYFYSFEEVKGFTDAIKKYVKMLVNLLESQPAQFSEKDFQSPLLPDCRREEIRKYVTSNAREFGIDLEANGFHFRTTFEDVVNMVVIDTLNEYPDDKHTFIALAKIVLLQIYASKMNSPWMDNNDGAMFRFARQCIHYGVVRRHCDSFRKCAKSLFFTVGDIWGYPLGTGRIDDTIKMPFPLNKAVRQSIEELSKGGPYKALTTAQAEEFSDKERNIRFILDQYRGHATCVDDLHKFLSGRNQLSIFSDAEARQNFFFILHLAYQAAKILRYTETDPLYNRYQFREDVDLIIDIVCRCFTPFLMDALNNKPEALLR